MTLQRPPTLLISDASLSSPLMLHPTGGRAADPSALQRQSEVMSTCVSELRGMFAAASTSGPKLGDDSNASATASAFRLDAAAAAGGRRAPDASYFDQKVILRV